MVRNVKLQAFTISHQDQITNDAAEILPLLLAKLQKTTGKERLFKRFNSDLDKENDLISDFTFENNTIFGVMMRVELDSMMQEVPENLLDGHSFQLSQIESKGKKGKLYKSHYYFCLNNSHLVVNLPGNQTISSLQTYINWLIEKSAQPYNFNILCRSTSEIKLSDIRQVIFEDNSTIPFYNGKSITVQEDSSDKVINLAYSALISLFNDTIDLEKEELDDVISARLLLKIKKPRKMLEQDYQKKFGAMLKPIADTEQICYVTKKGQRISSEKITVVKTVQVEDTKKNGFLAEEQLREEMIAFLDEIAQC